MSTMASTPDLTPALDTAELCRHHPTHLGLRRRTALDSVNLRVPAGATLGLVGPNGSGKSTLLRLAAGVDRPSSGRIMALGGSPGQAAIRRRTGYLPEDNPFPGELTARVALDLLGAHDGLGRRRVRAEGARLLEEVGLARAAGLPLGRYSRGMGRRFGLAQAWLGEPELILLDEATAGLDAEGFAVLKTLLDRSRERGATVVLASHILSDIVEHCDRVAVLVDGRLLATGPTAEVMGSGERRRLEVSGLSDDSLAGLRRWLGEHGCQLLADDPAGRPLVELFHGGRADVGAD